MAFACFMEKVFAVSIRGVHLFQSILQIVDTAFRSTIDRKFFLVPFGMGNLKYPFFLLWILSPLLRYQLRFLFGSESRIRTCTWFVTLTT